MAPGKKKKKPAANPARGFATTSLVSKKTLDAQADLEATANESRPKEADAQDSVLPEASKDDSFHSVSKPGNAVTRSDLSPEEFERQLEEAELQQWLDKHAVTAKRETIRQVSRLQTERRLLRGQAEHLNSSLWLSSDLMDHLLDLLRVESSGGLLFPPSEANIKTKEPTEEHVTIRLWTLKQTLLALDFAEQDVQMVLDHVLSINLQPTKDMIWGLAESMDWFALHTESTGLPAYEGRRQRIARTPIETPETSGTTTPATSNNDEKLAARLTPNSKSNSGAVNAKEPLYQSSTTSMMEKVVTDDGDSDLDPEELVTAYIATKLRLHELQPVLSPSGSRKSKATAAKPSTNRSGAASTSPEVVRLQAKLKRIERDILFDRHDADSQWSKQLVEFERQRASRRRMGLTNGHDNEPRGIDDTSPRPQSANTEKSGASSEGDDSDVLGDFFAGLPEGEVDPETGKTNMTSESSDGVKTIVRDFGKWTGLSPRRVLEEACRSRDPQVRLRYQTTTSSTFAVKQRLDVAWSKGQESIIPPTVIPSISFSADPRSTSLEMKNISTPTSNMSEAFISTTALFVIFSSSPKDEKIYLRLPSVWRDLWIEYLDLKKEQQDSEHRASLGQLRALVRDRRDRAEEEGVVLTNGFKKRLAIGADNGSTNTASGELEPAAASNPDAEYFKRAWDQKSSAPAYQRMLTSRRELPMWNCKHQVLDAISQNQVVIICGETGCGKSTQVPSFILEAEMSSGKACRVYCTQPRRISAISLARRVSEELGERKNDLGTSRSMVGYAIRLESKVTNDTRLVYATTGIVMRMLERSSNLADITHLVLDEVHERSIDSDFLLIVLRKLMIKRPELKVILMSATVDAQRFSSYLDDAVVLNVPGRTFPVETRYLEDAVELTKYTLDGGWNPSERAIDVDDVDEIPEESLNGASIKADLGQDLKGYSAKTKTTVAQMDEYRIDYDLVTKLIEKIAVDQDLVRYSKAILVFLPGIAEIRKLNDLLAGHPTFSTGWYVYPLHSTIASEEQEQAFLVPPAGIRKVVLATNIAETGITIPDITCVVDTGKHKEMRFDERRQLSRLIESFISRANAKQRRGRAGRVQEGLCFHMFTKARHDRQMAEQQTPEMLRLSLQDLVLRVKICRLGDIEDTLAQALDAPSAKNVRRAIDALVDVKALTLAEELTPLGRQLAKLPLDVHLGKLVLLGSIYKCLDVALTIAAILSSKSPFSAPIGARSQADQVRHAFKRGDSDLLTIWNAYSAWRRVCSTRGTSEYQFCEKNFLNQQNLSNIEDLKQQLATSIVDAGFLALSTLEKESLFRARSNSRQRQFFIVPDSVNQNSENDLIVDSVIAWSFYPKLLVRDGKGWRNVANNQSVSIHPTSVNKRPGPVKWLSFYHIMQSSNKFYNAHETTAAEDFAIALLCGDAEFKMYAGVIVVDGNRIRFSVSDWKVMLAIKTLRYRLRDVTAAIFRNPATILTSTQVKWLDMWQRTFSQRMKDQH